MIVRGLSPRRLERYRFVGKVTPPPTSLSTNMVASGAVTTAPSAGFLVKLTVTQAIWIRRYLCTVVDGGGIAARLFVLGGMAQYQRSPFGNVNAFVGYPLVAEMTIGATNVAIQTPEGQPLTDTGVAFTLLDDWYELDDTFPPYPTTIQIQSLWKIYNVTAAVVPAIVGEELTYDLYDSQMTAEVVTR